MWKDTVTMGKEDTPRKVADLYAPDATLWGTVSEEVRDSPEQIYAYFVSKLLVGCLTYVLLSCLDSFGALLPIVAPLNSRVCGEGVVSSPALLAAKTETNDILRTYTTTRHVAAADTKTRCYVT